MHSRDNPSPYGVIKRYINVKTDFVGFHSYENAPDKVAFLRHNHRHKFHVAAMIEVTHEDRELEFFLVLDTLERQIIPFVCMNGLGSCEMIAEEIMWGLINAYTDHRYYSIEVSEDDENSGIVEWDPQNYAG